MLVTPEHLGTFTGNASSRHGNGPGYARQVLNERIIAEDYFFQCLILPGKLRTAHKVSLKGREAHSELSQRTGHYGNFFAFRVFSKLMAIERQGGFQAESVPRSKSDWRCPLTHDPVPQHRAVATSGEEFKTQRFAGITGAGHLHLDTGDRHHAYGVSRRLRERTGLDDLFQNQT